MPTATAKTDAKTDDAVRTEDGRRLFIVHATKFGVLVNWEEVHKAHLEGRRIEAEAHYFDKGDIVALSDEYIKVQNIARLFRESGLDKNGLPSIEPLELYEKRIAGEKKLAEAAQQADADRSKIEAERREFQDELRTELEKTTATVLEPFTP